MLWGGASAPPPFFVPMHLIPVLCLCARHSVCASLKNGAEFRFRFDFKVYDRYTEYMGSMVLLMFCNS